MQLGLFSAGRPCERQSQRESYITSNSDSNFYGANGHEFRKMTIESLPMQEIRKLRSIQSAYIQD